MIGNRTYDLEDRLVRFGILIMEICELLPTGRISQVIAGQLSRCGTSPALVYGEVQAAESRADFIHKMKILLKELRETRIILRIIREKPVYTHEKVESAFREVNELIGIFSASVKTATSNRLKK